MASRMPRSISPMYGHRVCAEWSLSASSRMLLLDDSLMWDMIPLFSWTPARPSLLLMQVARRSRDTFSFLYLPDRTMTSRPSRRVGGVELGALGPLCGGGGCGPVGAQGALFGTSFLRACLALLLVTVAQLGVTGAVCGEDISSSSLVSSTPGWGATYFLGPCAAARGTLVVEVVVVVVVGMTGEAAGALLGCTGGARVGAGAGWAGAEVLGSLPVLSTPFPLSALVNLTGLGLGGRGIMGLGRAGAGALGVLRILSLSSLFCSLRFRSCFSRDSNLWSCAWNKCVNLFTMPV